MVDMSMWRKTYCSKAIKKNTDPYRKEDDMKVAHSYFWEKKQTLLPPLVFRVMGLYVLKPAGWNPTAEYGTGSLFVIKTALTHWGMNSLTLRRRAINTKPNLARTHLSHKMITPISSTWNTIQPLNYCKQISRLTVDYPIPNATLCCDSIRCLTSCLMLQ